MIRFKLLLLSLLITILSPVAFIALWWFAITGNEARHLKISLGFDVTGNAVLNGLWNETISSRSGRKWPRTARFINWLFNDPKHCEEAVKFTKSYLKEPLE